MNLQAWNSALFQKVVVERGMPDAPLFVYVDRGIVQSISGSATATDAVAAFKAAYLDTYNQQRPFDPDLVGTGAWLREPTLVPPFFASLCMSVLAVTEPSSDSGNGVYATQNQLLDLPATTIAPPQYSRDVPFLWRAWNSWLMSQGRSFGLPTASSHKNWTYQGWARSQGMIRDRDRESIFSFFDSANVRGDEGAEELAALLVDWLRYQGAQYDSVRRLLSDAQTSAILTRTLPQFRSNWIREVGTNRARHVPVRLLVDANVANLDLVVDLREADWLRGTSVQLYGDSPELVSGQDSTLYLTPLGENHDLMLGKTVALTDTLSARWSPSSVILLEDWDGTLRAETRQANWGQDYWALVRTTELTGVLEAMRSCGASPTPRPLEVAHWTLVTSITYDPLVARLPRGRPAKYLPETIERATLIGGLPLGNAHTYLERGEPDLLLPPRRASINVLLDGRTIGVARASETASVMRMRSLYLEPGNHTVMIGAQTLSFRSEPPERIRHEGWEPEPIDAPGVNDQCNVTADVRLGPRSKVFVVLNDASILEYSASSLSLPYWMSSSGLSVHSRADFSSLIPREHEGQIAFIAFRQTDSAPWTVIDVPSNARFHGSLAEADGDLSLGELVADPHTRWQPARDPKKISRLLQAARVKPTSRRRILAVTVAKAAKARLRSDVISDPLTLENPYDELLAWMSELETGRTSVGQIQKVWNWLVEVYGFEERQLPFRRLLRQLETMMHARVDWDRRRVQLDRTSIRELPNAMGLVVLTGSRPDRVMEALVSGGSDDVNRHLASLAQHLVVRRQRLEVDKIPIGPDIMFLELERYDQLEDDLNNLGMSLMTSRTPSFERIELTLAAALPFPNTWGSERESLKLTDWKQFDWVVPRTNSDVSGVGRYATARGPVYTYRSQLNSVEKVVSFPVARWLFARDLNREGLIAYRPRTRILLVPAVIGLPLAFEQTLMARSGLYPRLIRGIGPHPTSPRTTYLAFENVSLELCESLADALGLPSSNLVSTSELPFDL